MTSHTTNTISSANCSAELFKPRGGGRSTAGTEVQGWRICLAFAGGRATQTGPRRIGAAGILTEKFMSQHRSLRAASTLGGKRNVMKRFERVEILKKRGQWKTGDRITGLRKTKPEV